MNGAEVFLFGEREAKRGGERRRKEGNKEGKKERVRYNKLQNVTSIRPVNPKTNTTD